MHPMKTNPEFSSRRGSGPLNAPMEFKMNFRQPAHLLGIACLVLAAGSLQPVSAADTEAFEPQSVESTNPNVLFLVDSTLSLATGTTAPTYVPGTNYATYLKQNEACTATTAFSDPTAAGLPDCKKNQGIIKVPVANIVCDAASIDELKNSGVLERKFVVRRTQGQNVFWDALTPSYSSGSVYCEGSAPSEASNAFAAITSPTRLYYGNWLNWNKAVPLLPAVSGESRMEVLKDALETIATKYSGKINIGMMRTSTSGAGSDGGSGTGGMVVFPVTAMDVSAKYAAYYDNKDLNGDGAVNTLDDFIWTMRLRVACKQDQNCDGDPPPVTECKPNDPNADCVAVMNPNGGTKPLAEMLYEAYLYLKGELVQYGTRSSIDPTIAFNSVAESLVNPGASPGQARYKTPIDKCQKTHIILLTDGISAQDASSNSAIRSLVESLPEDTLTTGGYSFRNNQLVYPVNSWTSNAKAPSEYIDDLAFYLNASPLDVRTHTVGFALTGSTDQVDATQLLNDVAKAGGTEKAVLADTAEALVVALDDIITRTLVGNTAFSAPSVTINAFNRTQNLNDLYMAVFRPEYLRQWKGNVKKYRVNPVTGNIEDVNGNVAVSSQTGFFIADSQSFWSSTYDGGLAPEGGAASRLADYTSRSILTDGSGTTLQELGSFAAGLTADEKRLVFNLTNPDAAAVDSATTSLVNWLYGADLYDESPVGPDPDEDGLFNDGNGVTAESKRLMGDPLHSRPAVVVYGQDSLPFPQTGPDPEDAVVFITTNEGVLHALDARNGNELWAFAPKDLLYRLDFLRNRTGETPLKDRTDPRFYGIDGSIRVLRIDRDQDGPIDSTKGDKVFLFFGLRRGGDAYYAFDVTDKDSPKLLWKFRLPDGAQSWSIPTVGDFVRVNIKSAPYGSTSGFNNANAENRYVMVIGGGFDPSNDAQGFARDGRGNKIYMLDIASGAVLWSAGPTGTGSTANLKLSRMQHSIVADIRVVDLSGDRFADRMYAADLGGQVWRFDIHNGEAAADLVDGGLIASVGGEDASEDRRFYYAPDVAEVRCGGQVFYNVAIGSGDRENPVSETNVRNAFFSFRDKLMRTQVPTANYKTSCTNPDEICFQTILDDSSLVDVTTTATPTIGADKAGWRMDLISVSVDGTTGTATTAERGEKALAESRTFAGGVYFTTYAPETRDRLDCSTNVGINRLYVVNACNAAPVFNYDGQTGSVTVADRSRTLAQGSIAPEVVFIFPTPPPGCTSRDCMPPPQCLVGLASCGRGIANRPVRVFWRERGAE